MVLIFYTGVFPLTFLAILLCQHRELSVNKTNQISRALLGLHREYRPSLYYFEFLQILRMQFIIGYAVFVKPGTIFQLIVAVIVSVTGLTLQTHMAPFRDPTAAYSGLVSSLAIVFVLLVCILLKSGSIAEALRDPTLGGDTLPLVDYLEFENSVINVALFTILFLILAYVLKSTLMQIYGAHLQHASIVYKGAHDVSVELRRLDTKEETLSYHTFLSHTWGSGQDVMRGLKQYLIEVLPDPKIFLDVDDLDDFTKLGRYIQSTLVVIVFVSKGYFTSPATLGEFIEALAMHERRKLMAFKQSVKEGREVVPPPSILLVRESANEKQENALSPAQIQAELDEAARLPGGGRDSRFGLALKRAITHWKQRQYENQEKKADKEARAIDDQIVAFLNEMSVDTLRAALHPKGELWRNSVLWLRSKTFLQVTALRIARELADLTIHKEIEMLNGPLDQKVELKPLTDGSFHVYASANNAGAMGFVHDELRAAIKGRLRVMFTADVMHREGRTAGQPANRRPRQGSLPVFLLYLDKYTWTTARSMELGMEVQDALEARQPILLVHECDYSKRYRHPVPFSFFFKEGITPQVLKDRNLYSTIAIPVPEGEHRRYGVHQIAEELQKLLAKQAASPSQERSGSSSMREPEYEGKDQDDGAYMNEDEDVVKNAGALIDHGAYIHGLHNAPDAQARGPEMHISDALEHAFRAAEERDREEKTREKVAAAPSMKRRVPDRALLTLGLAGIKGKKAAEEPVEQQMPAEPDRSAQARAWTDGKDWLGERLKKIGLVKVKDDKRGFTGVLKDIESLSDILPRRIEPSVVRELQRWQSKWADGPTSEPAEAPATTEQQPAPSEERVMPSGSQSARLPRKASSKLIQMAAALSPSATPIIKRMSSFGESSTTPPSGTASPTTKSTRRFSLQRSASSGRLARALGRKDPSEPLAGEAAADSSANAPVSAYASAYEA